MFIIIIIIIIIIIVNICWNLRLMVLISKGPFQILAGISSATSRVFGFFSVPPGIRWDSNQGDIVPFHVSSSSTHIVLLGTIMLRECKSSYGATQSSRTVYVGVL
jgi:hypothetical protein